MIDFRYHVVSIVAVFLALGLGLFIGSTSLRGKVGANITHQTETVAHRNSQLRAELSDVRSRLSRNQAFDAALEPYAVSGKLSGESVVVVSEPGVDGDIRTQVTDALTDAGATINGDVRLQTALLDPQQDQFLGTLADKVAPSGRRFSANGSGAERALSLLAAALVTKPQGPALSAAAANKVLAAYSAGKLLSVSGDPPRPAALAVVLAAPPPPVPEGTDSSDAPQQADLVASFAGALDHDGVGVVVAGPTSADATGGLLDTIRSDKTLRGLVSTVDSAELPSGVIATVFAAAEQADGRAGSYGSAAGADAPVPSPSPS